MTQTLDREEAQVRALFDRVERVEAVAEQIEEQQPANASELRHVAEDALSNAEPIRVKTAASLLDLSDRTVRAWVEEGVLALASEHPKRVDPVRLHQVLHLVRDLRAAGRSRDLLSAVWYRLQDAALLDREDLAASLGQLREGKAEPASTKDEELAVRGH
ncbi:helix-turn-helix domain-containing protein [Streptomyces sp. NBC_00555]|uniref:hypothetical protein n=1 Tax=Streptomyces sp. NBC_00555 TaxID=2903662 RepID=UPI002256B855|nr:hypothetical protein [Streptomyces sp. NBC_00555]MCX5016607.1 helix-turn-helix domain-containing protein [Streptomyces sp. NBC_00555]